MLLIRQLILEPLRFPQIFVIYIRISVDRGISFFCGSYLFISLGAIIFPIFFVSPVKQIYPGIDRTASPVTAS